MPLSPSVFALMIEVEPKAVIVALLAAALVLAVAVSIVVSGGKKEE